MYFTVIFVCVAHGPIGILRIKIILSHHFLNAQFRNSFSLSLIPDKQYKKFKQQRNRVVLNEKYKFSQGKTSIEFTCM